MSAKAGGILASCLTLIGLTGELALLRHELVDCYPFKLMSYPPSAFFRRLGNGWMAVLIAAFGVVAILILRKLPLILAPLLTIVLPIFFASWVLVVTLVIYGPTVPEGVRNFDHITVMGASFELFVFAAVLSAFAAVGGGTCSAVLWALRKRAK
jgi:multisubunit Na+/H+ antiporter MnhF subunit